MFNQKLKEFPPTEYERFFFEKLLHNNYKNAEPNRVKHNIYRKARPSFFSHIPVLPKFIRTITKVRKSRVIRVVLHKMHNKTRRWKFSYAMASTFHWKPFKPQTKKKATNKTVHRKSKKMTNIQENCEKHINLMITTSRYWLTLYILNKQRSYNR